MKTKLTYILAILLIISISLNFWQKSDYSEAEQQYKEQLAQHDKIILEYELQYIKDDSAYKSHFVNIDSIKNKRNENDTSTFNFSTDSAKNFWSERFGHH